METELVLNCSFLDFYLALSLFDCIVVSLERFCNYPHGIFVGRRSSKINSSIYSPSLEVLKLDCSPVD